jgi:hypothetical protein
MSETAGMTVRAVGGRKCHTRCCCPCCLGLMALHCGHPALLQRIGDTLAAAAFQALVPALGFGPSGMAAACVPVCAAWSVVAYRLGQRQQRLAAAVAVATTVGL